MDLSVFLHYTMIVFIVSAITAIISFIVMKKWQGMPDILKWCFLFIFGISMGTTMLSLYFLTPAWTVENPF